MCTRPYKEQLGDSLKYCNLKIDGKQHLGIGIDGHYLLLDDLKTTTKRKYQGLNDTASVIRNPASDNMVRKDVNSNLKIFNKFLLDEEDLQFLPCMLNPRKIVCIGLNYRRHARETGASIPKFPVIFSKFSDTVTGHREEIALPKTSEKVDYEAELGIVMGLRTFRTKKEDALEQVYGYFPANDVSARDLQFTSSQWLLGKTSPGFAPIGPCVTTRDEIENPNALRISTTVNGEVRQDSNTADMIFDCATVISYCSQYFVLEPGDIILTGTPEGVILGMQESEQKWLKHDDSVIVEIERLGKLENSFRREN